MRKYVCDRCGKPVKTNDDLKSYCVTEMSEYCKEWYSPSEPHERYDLCRDCLKGVEGIEREGVIMQQTKIRAFIKNDAATPSEEK